MFFLKEIIRYSQFLIIVLSLFHFSCVKNNTSSSGSTQIDVTSHSYYMGAIVLVSDAELPPCNSSADSQLYYIKSKKEFTYCAGDTYQSIDLISLQTTTTGTVQWQGTHTSQPVECNANTINFAYYNSILDQSRICDGISWQTLTKDGTAGEDGLSIVWQGTHTIAPIICDAETTNYAYYNSNDRKSFICDGDSWEILSQNATLSLYVISTTPKNNTMEFSRLQDITIVFNSSINESSINENTISVAENGVPITGAVTCTNNIVTFDPTYELSPNKQYRISIDSSVTDIYNTTMGYDYTFSFNTRGWKIQTLLETDDANWAENVDLAIDPKGNIIAVWQQNDGTRYNILSSRHEPEGGWTTPVAIENDTGDAQKPKIVMHKNGNAVVVWSQYDGSEYSAWANTYIKNSGWGVSQKIETGNLGGVNLIKISTNRQGNVMAIWQQYNGSDNDIWANTFTFDSGWGTAELVEQHSQNAENPEVAIDPTGNAIAVWYQHDGVRTNVWANRYVYGTGWESAATIETQDGYASPPMIVVDSSGNGIAVWSQYDGLRTDVWYNSYSPSSGWANAQLLENDNSGAAMEPQIAIDGADNVLVVWSQNDGSKNNILSRRYSPISGWNTIEYVETNISNSAILDSVAVNYQGDAIVLIGEKVGLEQNIWASQYTHNRGWSSAELIEHNAGDSIYSRVIINNNGYAAAAWQQYDSDPYNIWATVFY